MLSTEFIEFLYQKFDLHKLPFEMKNEFLDQMEDYINHPRSSHDKKMPRRDEATVQEHLKRASEVLTAFGFSLKDIVFILCENTTMIHDSSLYHKLLFTGVIHPSDISGEVRRNLIMRKARGMRVSLALLNARYSLMQVLEYPEISWSSLYHDSEGEFAKKFVLGKYYKPYQIYANARDISSNKLRELYPLDISQLEFLKELEANKEFVYRYEGLQKNV